MNLFSTILLIHTLRSVIGEIDLIDPDNSALAQLRFTLNQQIELIAQSGRADTLAQIPGHA
jgi:hypothetical protein